MTISHKLTSERPRIVIFGAGKIGRSFIGQVFSRSDYEVVFVDINRHLIDQLNKYGQYNVVIKGMKDDETILITNVRGIYLEDADKVITELADASISALSVGQQGLPAALPLIAQALLLRKQKHPEWPLDVIIAENMRHSDVYIHAELKRLLPADYAIDSLVGLVETSIGKMVPLMSQKDRKEDPLQVFAESYNTLIVAKQDFKNPIPEIEFLSPKDNIKAWVDRKAFIHNLGHATAAYYGNSLHPESVFMYEILDDPAVLDFTRAVMLQSSDILRSAYPDEFTASELEHHIDDLIHRFRNKALGDTIFRVGQDLQRKLGAADRFMGSIHLAMQHQLPYDFILKALWFGLRFDAKDETGNRSASDLAFQKALAEDIETALVNLLGFDPTLDATIIKALQL